MTKKVTFSDNVLTREMSIDKLMHSLEVKNPFAKQISSSKNISSGKINNGILFMVLTGSAIICILLFLQWRRSK